MTDTIQVNVGSIDDLAEGAGIKVEVPGHRVAVFRIGNDVYAIGDRCSHAEASLAEGEVFDFEVECPRHGSSFDLRTGKPATFPATVSVPVYDVEVVDGDVLLTVIVPEEDA